MVPNEHHGTLCVLVMIRCILKNLFLDFYCKQVFVKTDSSKVFFKLGIYLFFKMAYIYLLNNPGGPILGGHLTVFDFPHLSPLPNTMYTILEKSTQEYTNTFC